MEWSGLGRPSWPGQITHEADKRAVAAELAARAADGDVIGVGSGSTSFLALLALADRVHSEGLNVRCVPTSEELAGYCTQLGLPVTTLLAARPDWCFDGADEVDPHHNLIKGRGGAFVREKLVFAAASTRIILVDDSKFVPRLGVNFAVPIEVVPDAANLVRELVGDQLGVVPVVRPAGGKDGGVITEQGGLVMDVALRGDRDPAEVDRILLTTPGITATGLFVGFDLEVISG